MRNDSPTTNHYLRVRAATGKDAPQIHAMICELAEFEKLTHQVVSSVDSIRAALLANPPHSEALLAEWDGEHVGFALFFHNFSTFVGKRGLYLEDVYVRSTHRGLGIGKALLIALAGIARERNCGRFEWSVLDWNTDAIRFYEQMGAEVLQDWRIVRLTEEGIARLADLPGDPTA